MLGKAVKVSPKLSKFSPRKPTLSSILWSKIIKSRKESRVLFVVPRLFVPVGNIKQDTSKFKESWTEFCNHSTLDGLHLIGGSRKAPYIKISSFMLLLALSLSGFLCYNNLRFYLQYNIRTTISYETNAELPFPALTFCNVNMFKRSVMGSDAFFTDEMSFIYATNEAELQDVEKQNKMICRSDNNNETEITEYTEIAIDSMRNKNYKALFQMFGQIAKDMVKKCWWNKDEIDCNKEFVNHALDFTICFTFNQNSSELDSTASVIPVFGREGIPYVPKIVANPQQGLKLLLDTQQNEYCGSSVIRYGAGFRLLIHDTHDQISLDLLPAIFLSPGFEYTITMQLVTYDMRNFSESLGRCTSYVYNPMKPDTDYNQPNCFMECFAEKIWKSCKCLPIQLSLVPDSLLKYIGETRSSVQICDLLDQSEFFCFIDVYNKYGSSSPDETCPKCIRKCFETKYEYTLTAKRLSPNFQTYNATDYAKSNLVMVTFNFDGMTSMHIKETQMFTLYDLFIYWGNILGLFLGFSFVTLYEVFHQVIHSLHISYKHKKRSFKTVTLTLIAFGGKDNIKKAKRSRRRTILFS